MSTDVVTVEYRTKAGGCRIEVPARHQFAVLDLMSRGAERTESDDRWPVAQALHNELRARELAGKSAA